MTIFGASYCFIWIFSEALGLLLPQPAVQVPLFTSETASQLNPCSSVSSQTGAPGRVRARAGKATCAGDGRPHRRALIHATPIPMSGASQGGRKRSDPAWSTAIHKRRRLPRFLRRRQGCASELRLWDSKLAVVWASATLQKANREDGWVRDRLYRPGHEWAAAEMELRHRHGPRHVISGEAPANSACASYLREQLEHGGSRKRENDEESKLTPIRTRFHGTVDQRRKFSKFWPTKDMSGSRLGLGS